MLQVYAHLVVCYQLTFIVKAVYSVDAGTLVVTPQQEEVLRVFYLVG